jgi:hypothetical protein
MTEIIIEKELGEGVSEVLTEKITGYLKCVILSCDNFINFGLYLNDFKDIILFESSDFRLLGQYYLPLRLIPKNLEGEIFNFANVEWCLNDNLLIQLQGKAGTKVKIVLRYEEY